MGNLKHLDMLTINEFEWLDRIRHWNMMSGYSLSTSPRLFKQL